VEKYSVTIRSEYTLDPHAPLDKTHLGMHHNLSRFLYSSI
jgi:hypothetical protein